MPNAERNINPQPKVAFDADALRVGLAPIADRQLFVTYRLEANPDRPEKPRKIPCVRGGLRLTGSFSDPKLPEKLMTLEEALAERDRLQHTGIGLVFVPGCGVVGLDLDHCINLLSGGFELDDIQKDALRSFNKVSFIEKSQSGTGLHAIALGDSVTLKANGQVELFGDKNFLALTGSGGRGVAAPISPEAVAKVIAIIRATKGDTQSAVMPIAGASPLYSQADRINSDLSRTLPEAPDPIRAASALAAIPSPAHWDDWRNLIWAACAAGAPIQAMIDHSEPGSEDTLRSIWDSYDPSREGCIGPGTLYKMALDADWNPPGRIVQTGDDTVVDVAGAAASKAQPTDLWLSNKFVMVIAYDRGFRYDHSAKQWRHFQNGSWGLCSRGEQVEAMKGLALVLLEEALRRQRGDPLSGDTKKIMACAQRAQSAPGIHAALELSQSAPALAVSAEDFDLDPDLLNCRNGVVRLTSGELLAHDPSLMQYRQSPVQYDSAATCPMFDRFMLEISCNDVDWVEDMQRCLGYALSGHVGEEKLFFWLGVGANGKSVLANIIMFILGTYAGVAPSAFLMLKGRDNGGATPDTANLAGKRLVLANEVEAGATMSGQTVKVSVSTEAITARPLYGNPFTFKPTHKLFIRGNHKPIINDNDEGIWRRIKLVPFDLNLSPEQRDTHLEKRLLSEAPGILAWMVRGYQNWMRDGLRPARRVHAASLAYRQESDLLAQWVTDCCDVGRDDAGLFSVIQRGAYQNYRMWCHDQGLRTYAKRSFTRGLVERGYREGRQGSGSRSELYIGLRLKTHSFPVNDGELVGVTDVTH